ncbi:ankyrin repeat-containing domain protein [Cladorrhinum sp. PSN332]|nr:ankyrin repeat-containing domain protein [Cladorrhinum sp. PSN332]
MPLTRLRPSDEEWEAHKAAIQCFYLVDKMPQKELLQALKGLGLSATKSQLEYRLKLWNLKRNLDKQTWQYVDNRINKRKKAGKDSDVYYCGRRVEASTVKKETNRNREVTFSAQRAPPTSPATPTDVQISICTPELTTTVSPVDTPISICTQTSSRVFTWPASLPWLQFQKNYSHLFSSLRPQTSGDDPEARTRDLSDSLLFSFTNDIAAKQLPNPSKLASTIGITMPESYPGEHLTRAKIITSSSSPELVGEYIMINIFRVSNNLLNSRNHYSRDDEENWERVVAMLRQSGITNSPFDFKSLNNTTISAFMEKLLQWTISSILGARVSEEEESSANELDVVQEHEGRPIHKLSDIIQWLLLSGQSPNILLLFEGSDRTLLQHSVEYDRVDLVKLLLRHGADVNFAPRDSDDTPLRVAARKSGQRNAVSEMVHLLLGSHAKVTGEEFLAAIIEQNPELTRLFLNHGGTFDGITLTDLVDIVATIVLSPELLDVVHPLLLGLDSELKDAALFQAIDRGALGVVQFLFEAGANVRDGPKALGRAAGIPSSASSLNMVSYLIGVLQSNSTPVNLATMIEREALISAARNGNNDTLYYLSGLCSGVNTLAYNGSSPLHMAARHGHERTCKLLFQLGAHANILPDKPSVLHVASYGGNPNVLDVLIANGAAVDSVYHSMPLAALEPYFGCVDSSLPHSFLPQLEGGNISPLGVALGCNKLPCATKLIRAGAKLEGNELVIAVKSFDTDLFCAALEAGADPNQVDDDGRSALRLCLSTETPLAAYDFDDWKRWYIFTKLLNAKALIRSVDLDTAFGLHDARFMRTLIVHLKNRPSNLEVGMLEVAISPTSQSLAEMALGSNHALYEDRALMAAIKNNTTLDVVRSLLRCRPPSMPLSHSEIRAVAQATRQSWGCASLVTLLLEHLPPPNQNDSCFAAAALDAALERPCPSCFRALLDNGYRPSWRTLQILARAHAYIAMILLGDGSEKTPPLSPELVLRAPVKGVPFFFKGYCPLTVAILNKNTQMLQQLLTTGLDVDDRIGLDRLQSKRTPFQRAVDGENLPIMDILLKAGADVNAPPGQNGGATALQLAARNGSLGIAKQLLDLGANPNAERAKVGGRTALEGAAENGRIDMLDFLLKSGVETTGTGRRQYLRAVRFAKVNGHHVAAELLVSFREWTDEDKRVMSEIDEQDLDTLKEGGNYSDEHSPDENEGGQEGGMIDVIM